MVNERMGNFDERIGGTARVQDGEDLVRRLYSKAAQGSSRQEVTLSGRPTGLLRVEAEKSNGSGRPAFP